MVPVPDATNDRAQDRVVLRTGPLSRGISLLGLCRKYVDVRLASVGKCLVAQLRDLCTWAVAGVHFLSLSLQEWPLCTGKYFGKGLHE
jgi:hypothetical protein